MSDSPNDNRRILLVDDHGPIHDDFRSILGGQAAATGRLTELESTFFGDAVIPTLVLPSYALDSAFQGQEALQKVKASLARNEPYGLAFMDVRMPPGWDGIETIQRIWAVDPSIQFVVCTAYADYTWEEIYKSFGWTDNLVFLRKPFDHTEVRQLACALTKKWNYSRLARLRTEELEQLVRQRTDDLERTVTDLQTNLAKVRTLRGLLPICAWCKQVRNEAGYWKRVEAYLLEDAQTKVTHGLCPDCQKQHFPEPVDEISFTPNSSLPSP